MDHLQLNLSALANQQVAAQLIAELEQPGPSDVTWTKEYAASGTSKPLPPTFPPPPPPPQPPGAG